MSNSASEICGRRREEEEEKRRRREEEERKRREEEKRGKKREKRSDYVRRLLPEVVIQQTRGGFGYHSCWPVPAIARPIRGLRGWISRAGYQGKATDC